MPEKKTATWGGHPLLDPKDAEKLELGAAVNEFHHGMDRAGAEKQALDEYRKEHHARACAHHLQGMRAASASGAHDDAKRHYDMYGLHMKALGHEASEAVPPEVKQYSEGKDTERTYRFRAHGADQFLVNTISKSEEPVLQYCLERLCKVDRFSLLDLDEHAPPGYDPQKAFANEPPAPASKPAPVPGKTVREHVMGRPAPVDPFRAREQQVAAARASRQAQPADRTTPETLAGLATIRHEYLANQQSKIADKPRLAVDDPRRYYFCDDCSDYHDIYDMAGKRMYRPHSWNNPQELAEEWHNDPARLAHWGLTSPQKP